MKRILSALFIAVCLFVAGANLQDDPWPDCSDHPENCKVAQR